MARSDQVASTRRTSTANGAVVLTVGHSTREQEDFIALLKAHGVKRLVDVRAIRRSRHNPQFNREPIGPALRRAGISYLHMPALRVRQESVSLKSTIPRSQRVLFPVDFILERVA